MPNKYEEYYELAKRTEENLTRSKSNWTAFLDTAARVYKYPYSEQLLIFAQRPEATACAEFSVWNETMNRFVKKGSKGIALLDKGNKGESKVRYVFDVADTGTTPKSKNVNLWEFADEHENAIVERLNEGTFATNVEAAEASGYVREKLAERLLYLYQDLSDEAREVGYLSMLDNLGGSGYPERTVRLTEKL